jgi:hypothetical protein
VLATHHKALVLVPVTIIAWVTATLVTRPVDMETLRAFRARVRPGGAWGPVASTQPEVHSDGLALATLRPWTAGVAMTYGLTFGIGKLLLGDGTDAAWLLGLAVIGGAVVARELMRD